MKSLLTLIVTLITLTTLQTATATDHAIYPADYWEVHNHCIIPVMFTITDEKGKIELQQILSPGQNYTQKMDHTRKMGEAQRDVTFSAYKIDNKNELSGALDYDTGGKWYNEVGSISIQIPYFYYNKNLDTSGCMR